MQSRDELRRHAESRAASDDNLANTEIYSDPHSLIHELRVHQIELEMQNDELRRAQEATEQTRAELADLYDQAPVVYFSLDENAVITRANAGLCAMLGEAADVVVGSPLARFLAPESVQAFLRRFKALYREPTGKRIDTHVADAHGYTRILELSANRTTSDGAKGSGDHRGPAGMRELLRIAAVDVTERRHAEAQVRELLARQELMYRELRHRTSNNYQLVLGLLSLQIEHATDTAAVTALEQVRGRVGAMVLAQESLADVALDSRVDLSPYLEKLVRRIVASLSPTEDIALDLAFHPATCEATTASTIGLIVNELVTNAWKHAFVSRGSGRLIVRLEKHEPGWSLLVEDDGNIGADEPAGERRQGLGETLVSALTAQLGGDFDRQTTRNGTKCRVRLPRGCITGENSTGKEGSQ